MSWAAWNAARGPVRVSAALLVLRMLLALGLARAAAAAQAAAAAGERDHGYCEPRLLTGTIYAKAPAPARQALFQFRRTSLCEGGVVRVLREYRLPDATLAARERVVYRENRLASYELEDLRAGETGRASVQTNADGRTEVLRLEFGAAKAGKTEARETLQPNTLINDMLPGFMAAHWQELIQGARVKFRFVALARAETVGFELVKDSELILDGSKVVRLRMAPTSIVLAPFVDPLFFLVEKEGAHRILRYTGRTTPRVSSGRKWKDLDAETVFDWK